jgi:putative spermidine/putrescine transport system substrate-binding protein
MHRIFRTLLFLAVGLTGYATASARDLTIIGWGGTSQAAWRKAYYEPFTKETGLSVVEDSWSGGIGTLRTKVQGGNPDWDIVEVESDELIIGCDEGLYEPIDWSVVGGKDKFIPAAVSDCGVGEELYSIGLAYDGDKLAEGPKSWADFWDIEKFPGKRALRKGPKLTLEFALLADGVAREDVYKVLRTPEGVDRAFRKLDELKPNIVWWTAGSQAPQLLISGEVAMAACYFSRVGYTKRYEGKHLKAVWDGSLYQVDFLVVLKGSPNKEAAMKLLGVAMRPENQSKLPGLSYLSATGIQAAKDSDPIAQPDLTSNPEHMAVAIPVDAEFWVDNIEALTKRFNNWASN